MFVNNREVLKGLALNTGTTSAPTYTEMCTTTEMTCSIDLEEQDWYVWCDAIQRSLITGAAISFETTVKFDVTNKACMSIIDKIHTLLVEGSVAQFNNQTIQLEVLKSVADGVLTYTKYNVPCVLNFSELGGAAEDASEFGLTIKVIGKSTIAE